MGILARIRLQSVNSGPNSNIGDWKVFGVCGKSTGSSQLSKILIYSPDLLRFCKYLFGTSGVFVEIPIPHL